MNRVLLLATFICCILGTTVNAQQRYLDPIFDDVTVTTNVMYGVNATVITYNVPAIGEAIPQPLMMDVYTPTNDTETDRPVYLLFHTGNFLPFPDNGGTGGTKEDSVLVEICTDLAKRGFVAAAVSYRSGWNPLAPTQDQRVFGLINAAYRGIQDTRTAVRYMRLSADQLGNPYGINPEKIGIWGDGTGGYLTLNTAALDAYEKILIPKFITEIPDGTGGTIPYPMIQEAINGDIYGTSVGVVDAVNSAVTGFNLGDTLAYPNHIGYSSDISIAVNMGGALGDTTWLDAGQAPIISFQTPTDPFAPYTCGIVNVPVVNLPVVEACGAYTVASIQTAFGNNQAWTDFGFNDSYSEAANVNNDGFEGLMPLLVEDPTESAPWQFWADDNPNSSEPSDPEAARIYLDSIYNYVLPRTCITMDLNCDLTGYSNTKEVVSASAVGLKFSPNPASSSIVFTSNDESPMLDVVVYDLQGRTVATNFEVNNSTFELNRNDMINGMYYVQIRFEAGISTQKVVFN